MEQKKTVMWALTYKCNMKCRYCYLKNISSFHDDISESDCISIANKICLDPHWKPDAVWLTGGEPTLKPFLPKLVRLFREAGIGVVIDTNGMCGNKEMVSILEEKPDGIIISLDSYFENGSPQRGNEFMVMDRIKFIAKHKQSSTILGTAVVIDKDSISHLYEYAKKVRNLGVEYISLNPYHSSDVTDERNNIDVRLFVDTIDKIKSKNIIKLPSDNYLNLIIDLYIHKISRKLQCPAFYNYYFISPWGYVYPCSNELWQQPNIPFILDSTKVDSISHSIQLLARETGFERKTNQSNCFGSRCIGCWKLYYDTIFTK